MPLSEGSRGERDAPRTSKPTRQQRLYLIFDDWKWGYSIYKLKLPLRSPHQLRLRPLEQRRLRRPEHKRLPPPCICLEAPRGRPMFFGAVGTNIIAAHPRCDMGGAPVPELMLPIVDVHSLGIRIGPGLLYPVYPIFIAVGDKELFALDGGSFRMLSMELLCSRSWSWCDLPDAPLSSMEVTSFTVDGRTILVSTDCATFAFDIDNSKWETSSNCSLPFSGPANYVHALDIFVGLSKDLDTYGHLSFCRKLGGDENAKLSKENLSSEDPAESVVGVTLVYLGGSEPGFCLVECVSITEGKSVNMRLEECELLVKCVDEGGGNCRELDQLKKYVDEGGGNCRELDQLKKYVDEGDGVSGSMQGCGELDELKFVDEGDGASGSMQECVELDVLKEFVDEGDGVLGSMQECGELDELKKSVDEGDGSSGSIHARYFYRLTTFSLSFDNNGDLTTGETRVVQYYKAPKEVSKKFYLGDPVAFWL